MLIRIASISSQMSQIIESMARDKPGKVAIHGLEFKKVKLDVLSGWEGWQYSL